MLSFGCRKIRDTIKSFQPDVIHVSTPGTLVYRTIVAAKREKVPLVMSYHTHLPAYARKFIPLPGISRLANFVVRWTHSWADLTLVTSPELKREMDAIGVRRTAVWEKGVNTQVCRPQYLCSAVHHLAPHQMFSPEFRSNDTRTLLSQGSVNPLILGYVGRLSVEKNLDLLKDVMDKIEQHKSLSAANESLVFPDVHLVFVGTGPAENQLKDIFKGYNNVHFAGQLLGFLCRFGVFFTVDFVRAFRSRVEQRLCIH